MPHTFGHTATFAPSGENLNRFVFGDRSLPSPTFTNTFAPPATPPVDTGEFDVDRELQRILDALNLRNGFGLKPADVEAIVAADIKNMHPQVLEALTNEAQQRGRSLVEHISDPAIRSQTSSLVNIPTPKKPGTKSAFGTEFDNRIARTLVDETVEGILADLERAGAPVDRAVGEEVQRFVLTNLLNPQAVPLSITDPDASVVLRVSQNGLDERERILNRFPETPIRGMRLGSTLRGMVDGGTLSKEVFDIILNQTSTGESFSETGSVDMATRQALVVMGGLAENLPQITSEAVNSGGSGTFRTAVKNLVLEETPQERASGESLFPQLQTRAELQADINRQAFLSEIDFEKDAGKGVKAFLDANGIEADGLTLPEGSDERKAHLSVIRALTGEVKRFIASTRQDAPGISPQALEDRILAMLDDDLLDGGFDQRFDAQLSNVRALAVSTPKGASDARTQLLFDLGLNEGDFLPERLTELDRSIAANGGVTDELRRQVINDAPVFQQEKQNADFAAQKPQDRQAQIGGALGFGDSPTFGTQSGGFTFRTPSQISQQRALAGSQANAAATIDARFQQALQANPFLTFEEFSRDLRRPGTVFGQDRGDLPPRFGTDVPGSIARSRAEQPTIEGLLPFQVPGSESEALQFGGAPPNPPTTFGQPVVPTGNAFARRRPRPAQPLFELDTPDSLEFQQLASDLAGGDLDFQRVLLNQLGSTGFQESFVADARERALEERRSDRSSTDSFGFREERSASGAPTGRAGFARGATQRGRIGRVTERVRPTTLLGEPTTTLPFRASFGDFARRELSGFRQEFEASPAFAEREEFRRNRTLRRPGQATFRRLGSGR